MQSFLNRSYSKRGGQLGDVRVFVLSDNNFSWSGVLKNGSYGPRFRAHDGKARDIALAHHMFIMNPLTRPRTIFGCVGRWGSVARSEALSRLVGTPT